MEVFMKVLEFFAKVATPKPNVKHVHNFDVDSHVKKRSRRLFDCEQVVHMHQYYAVL
jgi:hypothetical protein